MVDRFTRWKNGKVWVWQCLRRGLVSTTLSNCLHITIAKRLPISLEVGVSHCNICSSMHCNEIAALGGFVSKLHTQNYVNHTPYELCDSRWLVRSRAQKSGCDDKFVRRIGKEQKAKDITNQSVLMPTNRVFRAFATFIFKELAQTARPDCITLSTRTDTEENMFFAFQSFWELIFTSWCAMGIL